MAPPIGLTLYSNQNITNIKGYFSDLYPSNNEGVWISRNSFRLNPDAINITSSHFSNIEINFNINNSIGAYKGNLTLIYDSIKKFIPIDITIKDYIPVLGLTITGIGAIMAFFFKFIQLGITSRDTAVEFLEKAEESASVAIREGKTSGAYIEGDIELLQGKTYFEDGRYRLAQRRFQKAIERYSKAATGMNITRQPLSKEAISRIVDTVKTKRLVMMGLKDTDIIIFIISSAALSIIIMQIWTQVYTQLFNSGNNFLSLITAFLLGYGSQSLIGETTVFRLNKST
jgi:hypothetical protein